MFQLSWNLGRFDQIISFLLSHTHTHIYIYIYIRYADLKSIPLQTEPKHFYDKLKSEVDRTENKISKKMMDGKYRVHLWNERKEGVCGYICWRRGNLGRLSQKV